MSPKSQPTKEKLDKLNFIKIKYACISKDTAKRMKRKDNPENGEKSLQAIQVISYVFRIKSYI
jgi:hypothetical protein